MSCWLKNTSSYVMYYDILPFWNNAMVSKNYKYDNKKYLLFIVIFFPFIFKLKFDDFMQDKQDNFEIYDFFYFLWMIFNISNH